MSNTFLETKVTEAMNKDTTLRSLLYERYNTVQMSIRAKVLDRAIKERRENIREKTIRHYATEKVRFEEILKLMTSEKFKECTQCINGLTYFIDWMDSCLKTINHNIEQVSPNSKVEMYYKLLALGKEIKPLLKFMEANSPDEYMEDFMNSTDPMLLEVLDKLFKRTKLTERTEEELNRYQNE